MLYLSDCCQNTKSECNCKYGPTTLMMAYDLFSNKNVNIIPIAGMPPHHHKIQSSNFIIGTFTIPEDSQVMTETCRRYSKF